MLNAIFKALAVIVSVCETGWSVITALFKRMWAVQLFAMGIIASVIRVIVVDGRDMGEKLLEGIFAMIGQLEWYHADMGVLAAQEVAKWNEVLPLGELVMYCGMLIGTWLICLGYRFIKSWIPTVN